MTHKNEAMHVKGKTTTHSLKTITICFTAMSNRLKTIIIYSEAITFQT
jgi:hypothetical protein